MDIRLKVASKRADPPMTPETRELRTGVQESTLDALFSLVSKRHPELAPILEDAVHQDDLEIYVNNRPVDATAADALRLRSGDTVALFVKAP